MQPSPLESGKKAKRQKDREGGWQASRNAGREAGRQRQTDGQAGRYFALK